MLNTEETSDESLEQDRQNQIRVSRGFGFEDDKDYSMVEQYDIDGDR